MIDLSPAHLQEVKGILAKGAPDCRVLAFGSRVRGGAQIFSDLDLLLEGPEALDWRRMEHLRDDFSESDLPFLVDVVDGRTLGETFRRSILTDAVLLQEPAL